MRLAAVERVGLQPFLAACDAVGGRRSHDSYRPGYRFVMTAWPASGDSVLPSDSYFGQVRIMPTMPPMPSLRR